jgi:hypothetical protein
MVKNLIAASGWYFKWIKERDHLGDTGILPVFVCTPMENNVYTM